MKTWWINIFILKSIQAELIKLLNQQNKDYESNTEVGEISESGSVEELSTGHFNMPYDMVREGIESSLREKWRLLKSRLEEANKGSSNVLAVKGCFSLKRFNSFG